ncbi:MAG: energy transducer TonB [Nitrospira sp. CG24C]|nr:MAG: energy transducer TonB [Nitrospira sp. CG24C]
MIAAGSHRSGSHKGAHVQGWLVSVLLHSTVAFVAILFMKQIHLDPQNEAFKWNVAMVSPTQQVQSSALPQNQSPARSVPSTTSAPSPPVQQSAPAQTLSPPQLLAQPTTPPISERTATPVTAEPTTLPSTQPAEPIRHEVAAPMATESTSIMKPAEAPMAVSAEPDTQTAQSVQPPAQMAAISPALTNAPTKRDYGWLSEEILRRVEELKRYPASARIDRAEGKVVVKAVINEDGNLGEVEVFQSSGYLALDKAAVETMRQAAPFHLPHPLGQPRMTIKIPMSYRLDR